MNLVVLRATREGAGGPCDVWGGRDKVVLFGSLGSVGQHQSLGASRSGDVEPGDWESQLLIPFAIAFPSGAATCLAS